MFKICVAARINFPLHFRETQKPGCIPQLLCRPKEGGCRGVQKVSWSPYSLPNYPSTLTHPQVFSLQQQKGLHGCFKFQGSTDRTFQIERPVCPSLPGAFLVLTLKTPQSLVTWLVTSPLDSFSVLPLHFPLFSLSTRKQRRKVFLPLDIRSHRGCQLQEIL